MISPAQLLVEADRQDRLSQEAGYRKDAGAVRTHTTEAISLRKRAAMLQVMEATEQGEA